MKSLKAKLASLRSSTRVDGQSDVTSARAVQGGNEATDGLRLSQPGAMIGDGSAQMPLRLVVAHFMVSPLAPTALSQCSA